jgi:hypothetical protein
MVSLILGNLSMFCIISFYSIFGLKDVDYILMASIYNELENPEANFLFESGHGHLAQWSGSTDYIEMMLANKLEWKLKSSFSGEARAFFWHWLILKINRPWAIS